MEVNAICKYDSRIKREILVAGMKGFEKMVEMDKRGVRSLYRNRWENFNARMLKKHNVKKNWYKRQKKNTEEESGETRTRGGPREGRVIRGKVDSVEPDIHVHLFST